MSKKIYMYFHAGSANHGCEAIVRSTRQFLDTNPVLFSSDFSQDQKYGVDQLVEQGIHQKHEYSFAEKVKSVITSRFLKSDKYGYELVSKYEAVDFEPGSVAMSIGGDNYCYGSAYNYHLAGLNSELHKRGIKTVLWGCSIEPSTVTNEMKEDFGKYDLIVARETISFNELRKYNHNTILACDPAFTLPKAVIQLPDGYSKDSTIGINISPLIQKNETVPGITMKNYERMIEYILNNTDYRIALIPHVVVIDNDDRIPLDQLYQKYKETGRLFMVEDHNCMELKSYIANCKMFIGARTHATIAAYSTNVPTLVIGYSTKAKGIAKDLFGSEDHYVLPVQILRNEDDMAQAFEWLDEHSDAIRRHLGKIIPDYCSSISKAIEHVKML